MSRPAIKVELDDERNTIVEVDVFGTMQKIAADGETTDGDPAMWGILMSDALRHVARAHHQALERLAEMGRGPKPPPEEVMLARVLEVMLVEIKEHSSNHSGGIQGGGAGGTH